MNVDGELHSVNRNTEAAGRKVKIALPPGFLMGRESLEFGLPYNHDNL